MVDYSKWDNIDVSDDEAPAKPQVHAFKAPQAVTIGGRGSDGSVHIQPQVEASDEPAEPDDEPMEPADEATDAGEDRREDVLECRALAERALRHGDADEAVRLLEKAMRLGGAHCPGLEDVLRSARRIASQDGGAAPQEAAAAASSAAAPDPASGAVVGDRYSWLQTRDSVELNVFVEEGIRAKDVSVQASETHVQIAARGTTLLQGEWEYKVLPEEDPDWELRSLGGRRAVRLSARKAPLPGGMSVVVWWKRALRGEPSIDVSKIRERKPGASESFAKAWEEAHVQFRERVASRQPIPVQLGQGGRGGACDVDG